ncbi:hypothetical protein NKJ87_19820 [Mesorhizobium sp. M0027]|uniref:hypothetical protein n=1 Tax=Mesorhizobium sp. M0027 TaxID=2956848 RepID=UPI00333572E5
MRKALVSAVYVALVGALQGCETSPSVRSPATPGVEIGVSPELAAQVELGMRRRLKDPDSAKFGPIRASGRVWNGRKEIVVCGFVNSKNSFGGYTGALPYVGKVYDLKGDFDLITMGDESPNAALMVAAACRGAGIPIT